jgi:hypothetical protein
MVINAVAPMIAPMLGGPLPWDGQTRASRLQYKCGLGMLPMLLGAVFSPLSEINEASAVPMGAILFLTSLIGFIAFFSLLKTDQKEK